MRLCCNDVNLLCKFILKVGVWGVGVDFLIGDYVMIKCVLYRDEGKCI